MVLKNAGQEYVDVPENIKKIAYVILMRKTLKRKKIKQIKGGANNQDIPYVIGERMEDVIANPMGLAKNLFKIYSMPVNPRFWKGVVQVGQHIVNTPISFSLSTNPINSYNPNLPNLAPIIDSNQIALAKQKIKNARLKTTAATINTLKRVSRRPVTYNTKTRRKYRV